jgi:hypothetical protein
MADQVADLNATKLAVERLAETAWESISRL